MKTILPVPWSNLLLWNHDYELVPKIEQAKKLLSILWKQLLLAKSRLQNKAELYEQLNWV